MKWRITISQAKNHKQMTIAERPFLKKTVFTLCVAAVTLAIAANSYMDPVIDWDILPYIACAIEFEETDPEAVHNRTYEIVHENVSESKFEELTARGDYRSAMYAEPDLFVAQLGFYRVKPLYYTLLYLAYTAGIPMFDASVLISVIASIIIALLLGLWVYSYYPNIKGVGIWLLILLFVQLPEVSSYSSPDALGSLFVFLAGYLFIEKGRPYMGLAALILSMLARPDNVIFAGLIVVYIGITNVEQIKVPRLRAALMLAALVVVHFVMGHFFRTYSWSTMLQHMISGTTLDPNAVDIEFSLSMYLSKFLGNIPELTAYRFPAIIFVIFLTFVMARWKLLSPDRYMHIGAILILVFAIRYVLYPVLMERFLMGYYIIALQAFVVRLRLLLDEREIST